MEKIIKINDKDILRLKIKTNEGKDTGEYLEFDLEDIELPLRLQEMMEKDSKNKKWLRDRLLIIEKKQDVKNNKLLSKNEEEKIKAINSFFNKTIEIYNMFLGANGVQKLLNGRKFGWTSLQEIDEIIEKQIAPYIATNAEDITEKIKNKYGELINQNKEVLK